MHQHALPWFIFKKKKRKRFLSLLFGKNTVLLVFFLPGDKNHLHRLHATQDYENVSARNPGIFWIGSQQESLAKVLVCQARPISLPNFHSSSLFSSENQHDTFSESDEMIWRGFRRAAFAKKNKTKKKLGVSSTIFPFLHSQYNPG